MSSDMGRRFNRFQKASVNDSSRTAIIANSARSKWKLSGCSLRITSTKQSEVLHRSPSAPSDHANSESHIEPVKKRGHQTVPRNFCGKGKSVDPFHRSAHKFDSSTFDLIRMEDTQQKFQYECVERDKVSRHLEQ